MVTRLAVHLMAEHMDFTGISDWQPKSIKIVNPDAERCRRAYEAWPKALFVLRDHALSEEHDYMFRDPEGAGRAHAESYAANIAKWCPQIPKSQIAVTGINEPHVWAVSTADGRTLIPVSGRVAAALNAMFEAGPADARGMTAPDLNTVEQLARAFDDGYALSKIADARAEASTRGAERAVTAAVSYPLGIDCTDRYYAAFCNRLSELILLGMAGNIGVGWPANTGTGTPSDWSGYERMRAAIVKGGHYLGLHEYWDSRGPANMWGWWAGRFTQCPWTNVRIIIGECGLDEYVSNAGVGTESRGWAAHLTPELYMQQLAWYDAELHKDPRIHSAQIFTFDFAKPWGTFDIRPIRDRIVIHAHTLRDEQEGPVATFREALLAAGEAHRVIQLNPQAALQKAIRYAGAVTVSGEFDWSFDGKNYVCQEAEWLASGRVDVFYCVKGDYGNVFSVTR
jgi:hypothetical protein